MKMASAFVPPTLVTSTITTTATTITRRRWTPTCVVDPSEPAGPRDLSATDRQYIAKIKARLMNGRTRASSASGGLSDEFRTDTDAPLVLPDDLDAMEDVIFERGPDNAGQVKLFGGWLDEAVAGRKARDPAVPARDIPDTPGAPHDLSVRQNKAADLSTADALQGAEDAFGHAMVLFNRGVYPEAAQQYGRAVSLVGPNSRLGGQYQLWQAQALDACGRKPEASSILQLLGAHRDEEVRKVSRELLFILTAPQLQMAPGTFLDIPPLEETQSEHVSEGLLMSNYGPVRTAHVEKAPEPHSLQWYLEKERPPKRVDNSRTEAMLVMAAVVGTLALMAAMPTHHSH